MGQFKPMVKMETTEPSVELKLKKGGSAHKKMKGDGHGHKPMAHKMDGGIMGALAGATPVIAGRTAAPIARAPMRPTMASRRRAMIARPSATSTMPRMIAKKGGEAESKAETKAEMKKINKVESELKSHEGKKASMAHKGLKKGGNCYAEGGVIKSEKGNTMMHTAEGTDKSSAKTGDVKMGNAGGYKTGGVIKGNAGGFKKGGSSKKAFASGGSVNDEGKPTSMPQGSKKPSSPVAINMLSGTFKKGGNVSSKKLQSTFKKENAPAAKAGKAKLLDKYSPYQKVGGGQVSDSEYNAVMKAEKSGKKTMVDPSSDKAFDDAVKSYKTRTQVKYPSGLSDSDIDKVIYSKEMQEKLGHNIDKKRGGKVKK